MAVQTSTTGALENAAKEMIVTARYTAEHNQPCVHLVESFTLAQGHDTLIVPKVAQMTVDPLTEGQDIVTEKDIGMTTISIQPSEVGGKVVITDKLLRQNTQDIWRIVGRQLGDAMGRRKNRDVIALFAGLNSGTNLGEAGTSLDLHMAAGAISYAKANKFGSVTGLRFVHHPNALLGFARQLTTQGATASTFGAPIPKGYSEDVLRDFFTGIRFSGVTFFETGDIDADANDDGIGAIFDSAAMGVVTQLEVKTERERDASLRAWELVITSDYGAFEIDDGKGAPVICDIQNWGTTGGSVST